MMISVIKILLTIFICYGCAFSAYAENQSVKQVDNDRAPQLSEQQINEMLTKGEVVLRKIKTQHVRQERIEHALDTEKKYQEALDLYHQKRSKKAKEVLAYVEDSIVDYKSTESLLRYIDNHSLLKFKIEMRKVKQIEESSIVFSLAQRASSLYQQAEGLGDYEETVVVKDKLAKVDGFLQNLKEEKEKTAKEAIVELYTQQQLDQIVQKADNLDQEASQIVKAGNYKLAKMKLDRFKEIMTQDLGSLIKIVNYKGTEGSLSKRKTRKSALLKDKGYQRQAEFVFRQGVDLYKKRKYAEAGAIFSQLAFEGDERSKVYLMKINYLIDKEIKTAK